MSESLNCIFYKYTEDPRVAYKNLGDSVYDCESIKPVEPLSDLDIRLIIGYPNNETGTPAVMNANYVAIDNKYYQITNKERLPANSLAIYATIDGLMSYWDEVKECDAIIQRSSNGTDSYIPDPYYQTYGNYELDTIASKDSPFSDGYQFVLTYLK